MELALRSRHIDVRALRDGCPDNWLAGSFSECARLELRPSAKHRIVVLALSLVPGDWPGCSLICFSTACNIRPGGVGHLDNVA